VAYDRLDWHVGGAFPADLPEEAGATHIGFFLAWAITRGLEGELHHEDEDSQKSLLAVRERRMTGRAFLLKECDTKFWEDDLNDIGNGFARTYYGAERAPSYLDDYVALLSEGLPSEYHVEDSWENFDKVAALLDRRFAEWKAGTLKTEPTT
jgi:hypothetical protein